jgi:hypothetical protein
LSSPNGVKLSNAAHQPRAKSVGWSGWFADAYFPMSVQKYRRLKAWLSEYLAMLTMACAYEPESPTIYDLADFVFFEGTVFYKNFHLTMTGCGLIISLKAVTAVQI